MRILFFGTPDFSVPSLKALLATPNIEVACIVTQPDRPQGRGNEIQSPPIKKLANEHHIAVIQPESIKKIQDRFIEMINEFGPYDIGVVIAFGQILPQNVLNIPKHGCVNVHASLLPRWRGAAPIQRAIMAGDKETGICLMKMEAGLDTGAIYATEKISIEEFDNFEMLHDRMSHIGGKFLASKIRAIAEGSLIPQKQTEDGLTYAHKITNEETDIDWSKSAAEISRFIRGLSPIPGAFTTIKNKRLKIFEAIPVNPLKTGKFNCGEIVAVDSVRLEVQCADKVLNILQVQLEGKKRMPLTEFLKGFNLKPGEIMGAIKH
ncbi:MAG: methionyl-tRNA formyltransferase [bacterium]|nr:methionyl-tRNA formyltransferase [bacterium]